MKAAFLFLTGLLSVSLLGAAPIKGAKPILPEKVQCDVNRNVANKLIPAGADENWLVGNSDREEVTTLTADSHKYKNEVIGTQISIKYTSLDIYYYFNTQNGGLSVEDSKSGAAADSTWLNDHDVTGTGYLMASVAMKNFKGGLMGDSRTWSIEVDCYQVR